MSKLYLHKKALELGSIKDHISRVGMLRVLQILLLGASVLSVTLSAART